MTPGSGQEAQSAESSGGTCDRPKREGQTSL